MSKLLAIRRRGMIAPVSWQASDEVKVDPFWKSDLYRSHSAPNSTASSEQLRRKRRQILA
ncbi:hypothetical protein KEX41_28305 (plasmid) [Burkholderia thailandensis]|uniref:hypothetical protein n=1 Tax=Burkholderia thailandensis TaxID=57975 RepID=UPI00192DAB50|nr:hypothetical protein [Burkholderia thailandensis]MBS2132092.1 hypothetical protein [Burkholderia thailandensis]QRA15204.1 hypothetical protein JMY07_30340 [Burkholderia thailandensis]